MRVLSGCFVESWTEITLSHVDKTKVYYTHATNFDRDDISHTNTVYNANIRRTTNGRQYVDSIWGRINGCRFHHHPNSRVRIRAINIIQFNSLHFVSLRYIRDVVSCIKLYIKISWFASRRFAPTVCNLKINIELLRIKNGILGLKFDEIRSRLNEI